MNATYIKECIYPESNKVRARCPKIDKVPVATMLAFFASLLVEVYAPAWERVCIDLFALPRPLGWLTRFFIHFRRQFIAMWPSGSHLKHCPQCFLPHSLQRGLSSPLTPIALTADCALGPCGTCLPVVIGVLMVDGVGSSCFYPTMIVGADSHEWVKSSYAMLDEG